MPRPTSQYGVRLLPVFPVTTAVDEWRRIDVAGLGIRFVQGLRESYRVRFVMRNEKPMELLPRMLRHGKVLPIRFEAVEFSFGDVLSAPSAETLYIEVYDREVVAVVGTEAAAAPNEYRTIATGSALGGAALAAGAVLELYDSIVNDPLFSLNPSGFPTRQQFRQDARDTWLEGYVVGTFGPLNVYLLAYRDAYAPEPAGAEPIPTHRAQSRALAGIPAGVYGTAALEVWSPHLDGANAAYSLPGALRVPRGGFALRVHNTHGVSASELRWRFDLVTR